MVRKIVRDPLLLSRPSVDATPADRQVIVDLTDTLQANAERCVGLAANMIGVHKRILVFSLGFMPIAMVNPVILKKKGPYEAEEGCLSLDGVRKTMRYREIEVRYLDARFCPRTQVFSEFTAQIIQHEMDHFEGILI